MQLQNSELEACVSGKAAGLYLVGAGVVGLAILQSHIDSGISVWLADQNEQGIVSQIRIRRRQIIIQTGHHTDDLDLDGLCETIRVTVQEVFDRRQARSDD